MELLGKQRKNTAMTRISDKRERLIEAAKFLFHKRGFTGTTLADIAEESHVPLGNVYYYFKTKEDLAAAVIDVRRAEYGSMYELWEQQESSKDRLLSYLSFMERNAAEISRSGCPLGSLCLELNKENSTLSPRADGVLLNQLDWLCAQFDREGMGDARKLATHLMTSLQGSSLLSNALHDPKILREEILRLQDLVVKIFSQQSICPSTKLNMSASEPMSP